MPSASALLGTWRMLSWTRKAVASGEVTNAMGPEPLGFLSYQADGRMMALVVSRGRLAPKGVKLTDDEKAALFDSMLAYCGSYAVDDGRITHRVDASWNPLWGLTELIRPYSINGDRLVISDAPGTDPVTGEEVNYRIEFQKV